ncbi:MAG: excinuclease ABC subunit UvrC [Gammaproteobacteria bacterium]|nr:MAG: excinuclease ABC subunit UvrC [Gammaproteobacteria bacterium]
MSVEAAQEPFDVRVFLDTLSHGPGVYRMLDAQERIIYVGKARDLRRRVGSYFQGRAADTKTMALRNAIARCEVTVTRTETEALLLENALIKEHRPRFNVLLRDDKSYPYIYLASEHDYPRLAFYRGPRKGEGRYFGPYPSAGAVRETLNQLQKLFRIRQCEDSFFANRTRPCLQYQIRRCTGPCVGLISREDYARDVADAQAFLQGRSNQVTEQLAERMETAAERLDFETAARLRDQIARLKRVEERQFVAASDERDIDVLGIAQSGGIACVTVLFIRGGRLLGSRSHFPRGVDEAAPAEILQAFIGQHYADREVPRSIIAGMPLEDSALLEAALGERAGHRVEIRERVRGERARWLEMARANADQALEARIASDTSQRAQREDLAAALGLAETPERMECFDVSHLGGSQTVASCVVFGPEGAQRNDYRRFNIDGVMPGDDYAALAQAVRRRYTRLKQGEGVLPDVLFIDGGRGQLSAVTEVLDEMQLDGLSVVAVAKGHARKAGRERLFLAGREEALILPANSRALHLVQQLRDEAHRFAITGQRARRSRSASTSQLESIPGLGPKRRRELLKAFGGLQGVARAGVDDLLRVHGISRQLAQRVYDHFHGERR